MAEPARHSAAAPGLHAARRCPHTDAAPQIFALAEQKEGRTVRANAAAGGGGGGGGPQEPHVPAARKFRSLSASLGYVTYALDERDFAADNAAAAAAAAAGMAAAGGRKAHPVGSAAQRAPAAGFAGGSSSSIRSIAGGSSGAVPASCRRLGDAV